MSVSKYPSAGSGAEILSTVSTLSADGPITAIVAAKLGLKVALVTNNMGDDIEGREALSRLRHNGLIITSRNSNDIKTAKTLVLCDSQNTRTWFSALPNVIQQLLEIDLSPLKSAQLAYIDYYPIIQSASNRAIEFCVAHHIPLFVNLGGAWPSEENIEFLAHSNIRVLQTNIENFVSIAESNAQLESMWSKIRPEVMVVTLGEHGCLARTSNDQIFSPAYPVKILYTNGAGASFSGALAYGMLHGMDMNTCLALGSAAGAINCMEANGYLKLSVSSLEALLASRGSDF
jgi:sugar/nucleoside kinase (ribokinase family)